MHDIRERAAAKDQHIVLPEAADPRVQKAARFLVEEKICDVTVMGANNTGSSKLRYVNLHDDVPGRDDYIQALWKKRKHKLQNIQEAEELLSDPLYFAASMVEAGAADGCVAGSVATTAEVLRAAIHVLGLKPGTSVVSSTFLMAMPNGRVFTYADCGVVPYPDEQQLADIACDSARTHKLLTGDEPKVAMLSFSTKRSAVHPRSELVINALARAREKKPDLLIDGEMQFDAALVPDVAARKAPGSPVAGQANVFVFPNLDAGNIGYKITERLAGATATGPILQGLAKPMMDLSRGCSWEDIVNAACVAILMGE